MYYCVAFPQIILRYPFRELHCARAIEHRHTVCMVLYTNACVCVISYPLCVLLGLLVDPSFYCAYVCVRATLNSPWSYLRCVLHTIIFLVAFSRLFEHTHTQLYQYTYTISLSALFSVRYIKLGTYISLQCKPYLHNTLYSVLYTVAL
jgi:hypothetical protein